MRAARIERAARSVIRCSTDGRRRRGSQDCKDGSCTCTPRTPLVPNRHESLMAPASNTTGLPVIAFANRLPVRRVRSTWRLSDGGLVAALQPAMTSRGGVWVGLGRRHRDARAGRRPRDRASPGLAAPARGRRLLPRVREPNALAAAARARRVADLRPLLVGCVPGRQRSIRRRRRSRARGFRWVHDYHLLLLPGPAPAGGREGGNRLLPPRAVPAARGVLAAAVAGARCWRACWAPTSSRSTRRATATTSCARACSASTGSRSRGRRFASATAAGCEPPPTRSRSMRPISRDRAHRPAVDRALAGLRKQFAGRRLLLGVDRLDYTKGIPERLRAIELLLELRPDLRREITFVQVAVPSRGEIREYRELRGRRRAARRPDQRSLHRARARRAGALPLPRRHARPAARVLPRGRDLPRDAAPGRDEPRRQGVRHRAGRHRRVRACSC